jgi:hypothetical protein
MTTIGAPEVTSAPPSPSGYSDRPPWAPLPRTSGFAVAALIFGILPIAGIGAILAIVFGIHARRQIARAQGQLTGRGMATAGLVLGWIWIGLFIVGFVAIGVVAALGGVSEERYHSESAQPDLSSWVVPPGYTETEPGIAYKFLSDAPHDCGRILGAACWDMKLITHQRCLTVDAFFEINESDGTNITTAMGDAIVPELDRPERVTLVFDDLSDPRLQGDVRFAGPTIYCNN